jgi:DNA-binding transcriptional MerR regulator
MNQNQINYLNMAAGAIAGMRKEQALWENEPEIIAVFKSLVSVFDTISSKYEFMAGTSLPSYTTTKDNTFDRIIAATHKLARKLSAYAKIRSDFNLLPLVDVSVTGLSRGPEADVIKRCSAIADHAQKRLRELTSFKITEVELSDIKQLIADYNNHSGNRSTVSSDKLNTGREISSLISQLREKFDILDDLVEGLIDNDGFISRYKSLRSIIDYGVGKTLKNKSTENTPA